MASLNFDRQVYNREITFCKVYSLDSKERVEKIFLKNRISYFIEWQEHSWLSRVFGNEKHKNTFTIKINEADVERATDLVQEIDSVKIKKEED